MSEGTTALAETQTSQPVRTDRPWLFKKGQSGNPGGKPKGVSEFRQELLKHRGKIIDTLLAGLDDADGRIRMRAVELALAYLYGKPGEAKDAAHDDTFRAMLSRVVDATPALQAPPPPPEPPPAAPMPPETPVEPVDAQTAPPPPRGLRCLHRGTTGQCEAQAATGTSWCEPHRQQLLGIT